MMDRDRELHEMADEGRALMSDYIKRKESGEMNKDRPRKRELPKYITIDAHDGEGNSRPVRYINEQAIDIFEVKVKSALDNLKKYATMETEEEK